MSGVKGVQNVAPLHVPTPEDADYSRLRIPTGPWNEKFWRIVPHAGDGRAGTRQLCCVPQCGGPPFYIIKSPEFAKPSLCYAHYFQWYRDGKPEMITEWAANGARKLDGRPPRPHDVRGIDFSQLPEQLTTEIRFVAGTKIMRGDWTANTHLRRFLEFLIATVVHYGASSILERDRGSWELLLRHHWNRSEHYERHCGPYFRTFHSTLTRALNPDPWAEDRWLWNDCFIDILRSTGNPAEQANIRWDLMRTEWLRVGSKELAKRLLTSGERKWSTISNWVRGLRLFDDYLVQEGLDTPLAVDREVFLDFLGWVREHKGSKHNLMGVNTTASILEALRADGIVPNLAAPVYLRRGENAIKKPRNPRPYPADIIARIDQEIIQDPELDPSVRTMLRFVRWSGPRVGELVAMPIDILHHNPQGGYWVEYWMTKTETWRRFPVPDDLAADIRQQQDLVRTAFGDTAEHLFPGIRSKQGTGRTHPWTSTGFRAHIKSLFAKHGISKSTITGELVSGGEIHRYRHTVGTALLNNNWTQPEVQEFLGHVSSTMTSYYAMITDETLARKANEFHRTQNEQAAATRLDPKVERLRGKFSVVLPNGGCKLPANMKCDFRPNPCLDCSFFEPEGGPGVTEANQAHRIRLKTLITEARAAGNQAVIDLNQPSLDRLDQLLSTDDEEAQDADA